MDDKKTLGHVRPKQATSNPAKQPDPDVQLDNPSQLEIPAFLMNFPFTLDTDSPNNVWMTAKSPEELKVDYPQSYQQWLSLYNQISGESLVYVLPSEGDFQDQVYVANVGIVLNHLKKPVFIAANFKSPPRRGEETVGAKFMRMCKYKVDKPPFTWEGEADLKHIRDNIYIGGYGIRTDPKVYDWFEKNYNMKVIRCKMTDQKLYHWECNCFPLTVEKVMLCTDGIPKEEVKQVEKVCEIIPVPKRLAHAAITNSVRLVNTMICGGRNPETMSAKDEDYKDEVDKIAFLRKVCEVEGLEPIITSVTEYERSGAAVSCMVMHLNRAAYWQPNL